MKPNHHSLSYKMQAKPNKTYKELKQKQKAKISGWMYQSVCDYYREHGKMPEGEAAEQIAVKVYEKVRGAAIWVPYDEFCKAFLHKLLRFETRITEKGLPEEVPPEAPKKKAPAAPKKRGNSNKVCPECGRKMKQQFIGLQHCKCGMSWHKGSGYFQRTSDMVFALERRKVGKKVKQCPVIRYRRQPSLSAFGPGPVFILNRRGFSPPVQLSPVRLQPPFHRGAVTRPRRRTGFFV